MRRERQARSSGNLDEKVSPSSRERVNAVVALAAVGAMSLAGIAQNAVVDPDVWHEMALIREALALGRLPLEDRFAYTPTVYPSVHHEWGTGAILYFIATGVGSAGILTLKYLLTAGIAAGCVFCARRRGAGFGVLCPLMPIAIFLSWPDFSTVRAQMFTLLLLAVLLYLLDCDRQGRRGWIGPWLALYLLWVNLHAGFVVGLALCVFHIAEQGIRRRPVRHLILLAGAMAALIAVNPYGLKYYSYLWQALRMDRPLIPEWAPLWEMGGLIMILSLSVYGFSLLVIGYAIHRLGIARMPGLILVFITAYAGLRHQRHLSLYAVTWLCYVPAYIQQTKLGDMLEGMWTRRRRAMLLGWSTLGVLGLAVSLRERPWELRMPANAGDHPLILYPVGAARYLRQVEFRGNLMVPYNVGAFVTWKLFPNVMVSIDGRYEVAYPHGMLQENVDFYAAEPGCQQILDKYATDAVLAPAASPVAAIMPHSAGWALVYADDVYQVYSRPELALPRVDRRGERLVGRFP